MFSPCFILFPIVDGYEHIPLSFSLILTLVKLMFKHNYLFGLTTLVMKLHCNVVI